MLGFSENALGFFATRNHNVGMRVSQTRVLVRLSTQLLLSNDISDVERYKNS